MVDKATKSCQLDQKDEKLNIGYKKTLYRCASLLLVTILYHFLFFFQSFSYLFLILFSLS